jgi:hypothetical protein
LLAAPEDTYLLIDTCATCNMPTLRLHDVVRIPPQWGHHAAVNIIHTYARAVSHESCPALSRQAEHAYARVFRSAECSIPPHNLGSGTYLRCGHRVRSAETAQSQTPCFQHQKIRGETGCRSHDRPDKYATQVVTHRENTLMLVLTVILWSLMSL